MIRAGQIYLIDKPFKTADPLSWFAKWTKWMCQDRHESKTRNLWHCGLTIDDKWGIEIANGSFSALKTVPVSNILNIRDKNVIIYDLPLPEKEKLSVAGEARYIYNVYKGKIPFNHLCVIGLTLSNLGNKTGLWPHWGWAEKKIRYGYFCCEFVAYCFSKIGIYFRPNMDWWEGTTNDDIDDYCFGKVDIVYRYWKDNE